MKMKSPMKFSFTITIVIGWSMLSTANDISLEFPNYVNESLAIGQLCKNEMISLNFSNGMIISIDQDFISSPLITCLNFAGTHIQNIRKGAFDKLPNLTQLIFSNNNIDLNKLFDFGGHKKLKILILNNVIKNNFGASSAVISGEYPNLEILSIRKNFINNLEILTDKTRVSEFNFDISTSLVIQKIPFPKLKILDLSGNHLTATNFMELLPNSLYFLDLHDNMLTRFASDKKQINLLALNLDKNNLKHVKKYNHSLDSSESYDTYNRYNGGYNQGYNQYDPYNQYNSHNFGLVMAGLENLLYLSISENEIDHIESNAFEDTNKLVYLNLSINKITHLDSETFEKLQSLRSLDLSFNELDNVPQISSEVISILSLNYNNITNLDVNSFKNMSNLTKLLLRENHIDEFNVQTFAHLSLLEILDLSRNKLSFLPGGLSKYLTSLKCLIVEDNQFTSLESLSLTSMSSLMNVYLAMNPLEYLDVGYFKNLPQNLTINLVQRSNFSYWNSDTCESRI
ncbi:carboxypeptidase N subunit 2-like [Cataglyphis hispanica]|uniref:carboxypeptidase N subunit 2-like n=1 Tax=Cataglyphis hispanica TaxID=1086592 RepID=UPI0021805552|nr:carboxypeptidase N subunit 2-like [Cataglyphis hispanica]